jgi:hypothetical protein
MFTTTLATGITRTREFERKRLASYAVNVGTKCGHDPQIRRHLADASSSDPVNSSSPIVYVAPRLIIETKWSPNEAQNGSESDD